MRSFFEKLKKVLTPAAIVFFAAGLITIVSYLLFGGSAAGRAEKAAFLLILYFTLLILGTMLVFLFYERRRGGVIGSVAGTIYSSLLDLDSPVAVCTETGKILWTNRAFVRQCGGKVMDGTNVVRFFPTDDDKADLPDRPFEDDRFAEGTMKAALGPANGEKRTYVVKYHKVRNAENVFYVTVWEDCTEIDDLNARVKNERALFGYIMVDNLDDIQSLTEGSNLTVASMIGEEMQKWAKEYGCVVRAYDNKKYVLFLNCGALKEMENDNFSILRRVREIRMGESFIPVTLSIGIADTEGELTERAEASAGALETAVQRGGDQAAVIHGKDLIYFGGTTKTMQKKKKTASRDTAKQLTALICSSANVLIMGHSAADADSIASCVGAAHFCAVAGVPFNIVCNTHDPNLKKIFAWAEEIPFISKDTFVGKDEAQDLMDINRTLLIICDVNNPEKFEALSLFEQATRIVYIDHHRKACEFDVKPLISFIEPSASSASELVAEMLELSLPKHSLHKHEAELLLAGMWLDTHSFTMNTGVKTFGAAQYLKDEGADTECVARLFFSDLDEYRRTAQFSRIVIHRERFAITVCDNTDGSSLYRIPASKAADNLLSVEGLCATFGIWPYDDVVNVSARSDGTVNVQLIMEYLDGGGRFEAAGTTVKPERMAKEIARCKERNEGPFANFPDPANMTDADRLRFVVELLKDTVDKYLAGELDAAKKNDDPSGVTVPAATAPEKAITDQKDA